MVWRPAIVCVKADSVDARYDGHFLGRAIEGA